MKINYNIHKLKTILLDFHHITGLKICILDPNFQTVTEVPNNQHEFCSHIQKYDSCKNCLHSDMTLLSECKRTQTIAVNTCHAGLLNAAFPILLAGEIIGYVIMGEVRESLSFDSIAKNFPSDMITANFVESFYDLACLTLSQLNSAARTVAMLAISIVAEELIKLETEDLSEHIATFISENLCSDLSIGSLCEYFQTSKNILYKSFKDKYNCTINEYVTQSRMQAAKKLLTSKALTIRDIAEQVGISDEAYFCRLFKRNEGCTPLQYRKTHQSTDNVKTEK